MKTIAILAVLVLVGSGCVGTTVRAPNGMWGARLAIGYKADAKFSVKPDGTIDVGSYSGSAQTEFLQAVIEAAIAAGKK